MSLKEGVELLRVVQEAQMGLNQDRTVQLPAQNPFYI